MYLFRSMFTKIVSEETSFKQLLEMAAAAEEYHKKNVPICYFAASNIKINPDDNRLEILKKMEYFESADKYSRAKAVAKFIFGLGQDIQKILKYDNNENVFIICFNYFIKKLESIIPYEILLCVIDEANIELEKESFSKNHKKTIKDLYQNKNEKVLFAEVHDRNGGFTINCNECSEYSICKREKSTDCHFMNTVINIVNDKNIKEFPKIIKEDKTGHGVTLYIKDSVMKKHQRKISSAVKFYFQNTK